MSLGGPESIMSCMMLSGLPRLVGALHFSFFLICQIRIPKFLETLQDFVPLFSRNSQNCSKKSPNSKTIPSQLWQNNDEYLPLGLGNTGCSYWTGLFWNATILSCIDGFYVAEGFPKKEMGKSWKITVHLCCQSKKRGFFLSNFWGVYAKKNCNFFYF